MLVLLAIGTAACTPASVPTIAPTAVLVTVPPTATSTPIPPTAIPADLPPSAAEIRGAGQAALGIDPESTLIAVAEGQLRVMLTPEPSVVPELMLSEAQRWTASELRCGTASEDEEATVDGFLMYFEIYGNVYEFHTDGVETVQMCATYPRDELYQQRPELFLQMDPVAADLADLAAARIAEELDLPQARVELLSARPMVWDDASLGCPVEGEFYALQVVEGYRIVIEAAGRQYVFHSNFDRLVLCEDGITPTPTLTSTFTPSVTQTQTPSRTPTLTLTGTRTATRAVTRAATTRRTPTPSRTP